MHFLHSVKSLYVAVGILILTLGLGTYVDVQNEAMHSRQLEINTGLERVVRLNQELTNMLVIAVLKHNVLGAGSYGTVKGDLQTTMKTVTEITKAFHFLQEIQSLQDSQAQLREMEAKALQMINDDQWEQASNILLGDDYVMIKKIYEIDTETAIGAVMGELTTTTRRFEQLRMAALGLRVAALVLLVWVGVMFSRRSRADLAEQKRLREQLFTAYQDMEARVAQRTADLEQTTSRLAVENEEREKSEQRTRLILNSAGEGIFGVDAQGRGVFVNSAASRLLGYGAADMVGHHIHHLIHHLRADGTPLPEQESPMYKACVNGIQKNVSGEVLWRKDGSSFLSEYLVTPMLDEQGGNSGAVVVFRDITEQRQTQQELQRRMEESERFNRLTMGREERMIELKQEINALLEAQGRPRKYRSMDDAASLPAAVGQQTGEKL